MQIEWSNFLKMIQDEVNSLKSAGCSNISFRGHANKDWNLSPTLFVQKEIRNISDREIIDIENNIYFDFITNAGPLIPSTLKDWEILFLMRHHGIPTRILDWTENFATALFFALHGTGNTPTIWMFSPHELNRIAYINDEIPNPINDLNFTYCEAYIEKRVNPYPNPICIIPARTGGRLFAQKGLFTLHGSDMTPLNKNEKIKHCFKKFEIPVNCIQEAKDFLELCGVNNYSIFPDLDGLSKHLNNIFFEE
ncbi:MULTISPECIES: FRG domain-containing protein [Sphingobacterium]|uniref:FRG domain-containing protein n=1 Tax=Sphingobacterium TaxID=28453 RepID=UPI00257F3AF6|nr:MULTISPECIES: FRG domain-containing protein [Sphingobacterium]